MMKSKPSASTACRGCGGYLKEVIDLGLQPPSNAFLKSADAKETVYPLRACLCSACYLLQVDTDVAPKELFGDYVYFSSYSKQWLTQAEQYVRDITQRLKLNKDSFVIEVGSNDGYLLQYFDVPCLGIDPSDTVAKIAREKGIDTRVEFFGSKTVSREADLIICNNVLGHVPDLNDFIEGLSKCLKSTGTITIEFPHALNLIDRCEFDTIYHEHFSYLSLFALEPLLAKYGLHVYDFERLETHGGSLRLFIGKVQSEALKVHGLRQAEVKLQYWFTYEDFARRADKIRRDALLFLKSHQVVGYGAAAKGNTFLNFCGITSELLPYVADITPAKHGKFLPGSKIPVVSEEYLLAKKPPFVLILPWNWSEEIAQRLSIIREWKGQLLTAIPEMRVF